MPVYYMGRLNVPYHSFRWLCKRPLSNRLFSTAKHFPRLLRLREILESEPERTETFFKRYPPLNNDRTPYRAPQGNPTIQFDNPLVDSFGRRHSYLRLSVVERCSLRCTYCMPESGIDLTPKHALLSRKELLQLAALFVRAGVNKIRITGGEPLVRPDIVEIVRSLNEMRVMGLETIAMTTNAVTLGPKLVALRDSGLDCLNISLDTLDPDNFERISLRPKSYWSRTMATIEQATHLGFRKIKINSVILKGVNEHEIADLARLTEKWDIDVRFIELMPFSGNNWQRQEVITRRDIQCVLEEAFPSLTAVAIDSSDTGDVTHLWRISPAAKANVGVITTMTSAFCATCTRLRLTADGHVRVCLHGNDETNLLPLLRSESNPDGQDSVRASMGTMSPLAGSSTPRVHDQDKDGTFCETSPEMSVGKEEASIAGKDGIELAPLPPSLEHLAMSPQLEQSLIHNIGLAVSRKRKTLGGNGELFRKIMSGTPLDESTVGMMRPMTKIGG